jgi:capsular polysaccharide biosynthesis protein
LYYPNVLLHTELIPPRIYNESYIESNKKSLILPLLEKTMSLQTGTIYEKTGMTYNYIAKSINKYHRDPVFFFIYNTDNYFHFLYDTMPYLISFLHLKKQIPNIKLLMQYPYEQKREFYPFVIEFLLLLNISQSDIILINDTIEYSEIYISTSFTHDLDSNLPPRKEIYNFYKDIANFTKNTYSSIFETPKKIYISRRTWIHNDFSNIGTNYTTRRRLINENEIVENLVNNGYTEIFTEKLTTIEKILYFANATHIIGAIGGGISNVLFSDPSTKLEVLVSPTFLDVNMRFKYSLDCVDSIYNTTGIHVENDYFKTYMRVKTIDNNFLTFTNVREDSIIKEFNTVSFLI